MAYTNLLVEPPPEKHAYNFKQPGYTEGGLLNETKKKRLHISISIYLKVYSMVL